MQTAQRYITKQATDDFIRDLAVATGPMSVWSQVDTKTAEMREEGERLLATRGETAIAEPRADQIRVLITRRDRADEAIAELLRAEKDERGDEAAWLAWCKTEFGWGRSQSFARLSPKQIEAKRERDAQRQRAVRDSRTTEPQPAPSSDATTPDERAALAVELLNLGFKQWALKNHPDVGGSNAQMAAMAAARDWAIRVIGGQR